MRPSLIVAALATLPLALVTVPAVGAPAADLAKTRNCTITFPRTSVEPPLSLEGARDGSYHSVGRGTVVCGSEKGTATLDGRYGTPKKANCATGGDGWGVLRITIGTESFGDTFTVRFGPNDGQDIGNTKGERIDTKFVFLGTKGNCVTSPISEGRLTLQATIRAAS